MGSSSNALRVDKPHGESMAATAPMEASEETLSELFDDEAAIVSDRVKGGWNVWMEEIQTKKKQPLYTAVFAENDDPAGLIGDQTDPS